MSWNTTNPEAGPYSTKGLTRDEANSEKLSDLEELDPRIRAEFYSEVCSELTIQYFGLSHEEDYCLDFEANDSKKMSGTLGSGLRFRLMGYAIHKPWLCR